MNRQDKFSFTSLCGIAITTGESWIALGTSLALSIHYGGSPAVLFGFIATSACYWVVAASIAELASSMPHTATTYHWARITGGRYGTICSWYAGWWSFASWQVAVAFLVSVMSMQIMGIYAILNPGFVPHNWQITVTYLLSNWAVCLFVLFGDKWLPYIESSGLIFTLGGWFISIVIVAVLPSLNGNGYAQSQEVWTNWQRMDTLDTWSSPAFTFCQGTLNAALATCAPDLACFLAEEIPNPARNLPRAILAQYVASFLTGFLFLVTVFYATTDSSLVKAQHSLFPLSEIYLKATTKSTAVGLLVVALVPTTIGVIGGFAIAGRQGWALARGHATPFSQYFGVLNPHTKAPSRAIKFVGCLSSALGCLYLISPVGFNAIGGSAVVFGSLAYLATILPHLLSRRQNIHYGPFQMPRFFGMAVNSLSCLYLLAFAIIFSFPPNHLVSATTMNYTPAIVSGWTIFATGWGLAKMLKIWKSSGTQISVAAFGESE